MADAKDSARTTGIVGAAFGVVFIAVACGGKVTWVEDSAANTGGNSSTSSKSTTTATQQSSSVVSPDDGPQPTTSSGPSPSTCESYCAKCDGVFNTPDPNCVNDCLATYPTGCESQYDAALACLVASSDEKCQMTGDSCYGQQQALSACENQGQCNNISCTGGNSFCDCSGICYGNKVEAICKASSSGFECSCQSNGQQIGTCTATGPSCDPQMGCCGPYFQPMVD